MFFSSQTEVYIYREPVDMRKGHDGLAGIVESEMNLELLSGSIFLFVNKSRRLCKAIYFDGSGLVIIHKRMEVGSIMNFLAFGKIQKISIFRPFESFAFSGLANGRCYSMRSLRIVHKVN